MANKHLFQSQRGEYIPPVNSVNSAGAGAYGFGSRHALAQYVATGALGGTYYASATDELATVLSLAQKVEPEFVAKAAIYSREHGAMKDMPALLCAWLSVNGPDLLPLVFNRVMDTGRMLRTFVQIMRSGVVGRKSMGTRPRNLVRDWLASRSDKALFKDSVGNSPSMADIVKMVHPRPRDETREALYGWLIGRKVDQARLPGLVREFEQYKKNRTGAPPAVPFQMLTALGLNTEDWRAVAQNASWTMTRMNLNTFARHGVFEDQDMVRLVANRLRNPDAVRRARAFPYQILTALIAGAAGLPAEVTDALQDALDISLEAVPAIPGKVYVCPDVSGSMHWPLTGYRPGATSMARRVDVAGLVAAAVLRRNPGAEVLPFEFKVVPVRINTRDSVMTNAEKLVAVGGGRTTISAPLARLNRRKAAGDLVILVSDNESWVDAKSGPSRLMLEWGKFKKRNPGARLVCMDIAPNRTTQAVEREDILNIGGFSDQVFTMLDLFARGELNNGHWVGRIENMEL